MLVLVAGLGFFVWNVGLVLGFNDAATRPATLAASLTTIQPSSTSTPPASTAPPTSTPAPAATLTSTPAPAYVDELYLATATATSGPDLAAALASARIPTSLLYMVGNPRPRDLAPSNDGRERLAKYVTASEATAVPTIAIIPGETTPRATPTTATAAVMTPTTTAAADTATPSASAAATATPETAPAPPTPPPPPSPSPSPTPFTSVIYAAGTNVTIPKLNIVAPVYDGGVGYDGAPVIAQGYALTRFYWYAKPGQAGNMVLYGHDDIQGNIFAHLPDMSVGDRIYIDTSGTRGVHRYIYQVTGSQIVLPTDTWVMNPTTGPTITLLSCTPYGVDTHRIVIKGNLVEVDGHAVQLAAAKGAAAGG